jgi:tetratricopeptide (TPR) repeat protein
MCEGVINMQERLKQLALDIDNALDKNDDLSQFKIFLENIEKMRSENVSNFEKAQLDYYAANIYSFLMDSEKNIEYFENEIYHLRLANTAFKTISQEEDETDLRYRIETNLGNALNNIGRFVEALEKFDSVIKEYPYFGMAHGSKGRALYEYAQQVYDEEQVPCFLKYTHLSIKKALDLGVEKHTEEFYWNRLNYLNSLDDWDKMSIDTDKKLDCRSKKERHYRQ